MSSNRLIVSVFVVLALAAAALRIATGPIVRLTDGDSLYALAKAGPAAGAMGGPVEVAFRDARPRR